MKVPGYPSNREVDENAMETTAKAGRCMSRMRPSRETYLHRESIIPLGVGMLLGRTPFFDAPGAEYISARLVSCAAQRRIEESCRPG